MKHVIASAMFFGIFALNSTSAQMAAGPLDGMTYEISAWDVSNSDLKTPDKLVFENGMVDAPVCHQYGFFAAPYEAQETDGSTQFSFVSESMEEGTVYFSGTIEDDKISGRYTWKRPNGKKLNYKFVGKLGE